MNERRSRAYRRGLPCLVTQRWQPDLESREEGERVLRVRPGEYRANVGRWQYIAFGFL